MTSAEKRIGGKRLAAGNREKTYRRWKARENAQEIKRKNV